MIAGPGSGKSKTLIERTIHLVVDKHIPAENILLATFTEKAAKELVTRISNRAIELNVVINISDMLIGTLHSIFLRLLDEYREFTPLKRNYRTLDQFDQQYLIYQHNKRFAKIDSIKELLKNNQEIYYWSSACTLSQLINKVADENLDLDKLAQCESIKLRALAEVTRTYRAILEEENALDFSLIQTYFWNLIQNEDILSEIRARIHYLMIDEYQDTNRIQEQILLKLAAPENRICVVGDDDQALYRFRGATVENILRFQENFKVSPDGGDLEGAVCPKIELSKNYRSHHDIIDFYNRWMEQTWAEKDESGSWSDGDRCYRHEKIIENASIQTPESAPYTGVVKVMGANAENWFENFYQFIEKLKTNRKITDYNQIAVLARSVKNSNVINLAQYLEEHGVPVFSPRADLFFARREIRLIIGAFAFLFPKTLELKEWYDTKARLKVPSYPYECLLYFGQELRNNPEKHRFLRQWAARKALELSELRENTNYTFSNLFYELIQFPLFRELVNVDLHSGVQDLRPAYNLALFIKLLAKYEYIYNIIVLKPERLARDVNIFFNTYLKFLFDGGLSEFEDFDMVTPSGCVSFMTIHQSKGLEFPITCVASLADVPKSEHDEIDKLIAEQYHQREPYEPPARIKYFDFWRRYYTAFSRARNLLVLTGVDNHHFERQPRERFTPSKFFLQAYHNIPDADCLFTPTQLNALHIDEVTPAQIKHAYSFTSHILVYENCPIQYKFFRELEFTPVRTNAVMFGTLVHQTIEDVHRAVLAGHPERVTYEAMDAWLHENYRYLSRHTGLYLSESGLGVILKHVRNYVEYAQKDWGKIREAEVPVTLQQPKYILEGNIDLIRGDGDSVELLDFKSEKKPDRNTEDGREKLKRYRSQLEIYAYLVEQRYGLNVSKMHLYYTGAESESPFISFDYNAKSIQNTIGEVTNIVERIESKVFRQPPTRRCKQLCGNCDLKPFCDQS